MYMFCLILCCTVWCHAIALATRGSWLAHWALCHATITKVQNTMSELSMTSCNCRFGESSQVHFLSVSWKNSNNNDMFVQYRFRKVTTTKLDRSCTSWWVIPRLLGRLWKGFSSNPHAIEYRNQGKFDGYGKYKCVFVYGTLNNKKHAEM